MKKMVWTTDCHLNFCHLKKIEAYCNRIKEQEPDLVVLTGDISEAPTLEEHLRLMEYLLGDDIPVYFVCGNHDYYHGSVGNVRHMLKNEFGSESRSRCKWLPRHGVITITPNTALIGHDGWYDGGYADPMQSSLDMTDFYIIRELSFGRYAPHMMRVDAMRKLAQEAADYVGKYLRKALKSFDHVYLATHVAPFAECSRAPDKKMSDQHWMPYFASRRMGDTLLEVMGPQPPEKKLTVLIGHNHTEWYHKVPNYNIECYTGKARYKHPAVCKTFEVE